MFAMRITGAQLRAARALVGNPSLRATAREAGVGTTTLHRLEAAGAQPVTGNVATVGAVVAALEAKGVKFMRGGVMLAALEGGETNGR